MTAAPRRTDPIAAAVAFAIREAVRLEAERERLAVAPDSANVVATILREPQRRLLALALDPGLCQDVAPARLRPIA